MKNRSRERDDLLYQLTKENEKVSDVATEPFDENTERINDD